MYSRGEGNIGAGEKGGGVGRGGGQGSPHMYSATASRR